MPAAKKQPPKKFTSWSFSRYSEYTQCPLRAKLRHLDKVVTPAMAERVAGIASGAVQPGPMERGAEIAKKSEDYFKGKLSKLPMEMMPLADTYRAIKKKGAMAAEDSWGFTVDWTSCSPTDWDRCWLRVKIDVAWIDTVKGAKGKRVDHLEIRDNKTGKFSEYKNEEYVQQLELYGVAGLTRMPTVASVGTQLLYSDLGIVYPPKPTTFGRDQLAKLQATWEKRVKPMFADTRFAPKPGPYCRYCDFSKARGGPCKF